MRAQRQHQHQRQSTLNAFFGIPEFTETRTSQATATRTVNTDTDNTQRTSRRTHTHTQTHTDTRPKLFAGSNFSNLDGHPTHFTVYADSYALMGWVLNSCTAAARACRGCWACQSGCAVFGELPVPLVAGLPALLARSGLSGEAAVDADGFAGCCFRVESLSKRTPPLGLKPTHTHTDAPKPFQWESTDRAQIARVLPWSALNGRGSSE